MYVPDELRQAIVALAEPSSNQLLLVAEHGISSSAIVDFVLTRDDEAHPLIKAMNRREPSCFDAPATSFRSPIEGRFHAVLLYAEDDAVTYGLLLASAAEPEVDDDVMWVVSMLSRCRAA